MTESLGQDGDARGLQSAATDSQSTRGGQEAPIQFAQASINIGQPPAGEEVVIQAAAGQRYVIDFNPDAARAAVQGNDLVLLFANGGRVVFQDLGDFAGDETAPVFEVAGQPISGGVIYAQTAAQSGAGGAPSLETAAAPDTVAGTGETRYDDNTGNLIDLLNKQPGIPLTELFFRIPELEPSQVFEEEQPGITPGGLTPTVLAGFSTVDEDDLVSFSPPSQEQSARVSLAAILAIGQQAGSDTLDLGLPFDPAGSQPTFVTGPINANFGSNVPGTISFTQATITALEALNLTSSTDDLPIQYALDLDNHLLIAFTGDLEEFGELVFLAGVTPGSSNGAFEYGFELYGSINHPNGNGENAINLPIKFQVTDSAGNTVIGSFGISVDDDVPTIDFLPEYEQSGNLTVAESDIGGPYGATASTSATIVFGADGPESSEEGAAPVSLALIGAVARAEGPGAETPIVYDLSGSGGTSLTSGGQIVQIEVDPFNPLQINGFIDQGEGGRIDVFTAILHEPFPGFILGTHQADFTFELFQPLDHPDKGEVQVLDQIRFEFAVTVLDDDGDTDTVSITVDVRDDGPVAFSGNRILGFVEEDGMSILTGDLDDLSEGNKEIGDTNADDEINIASGDLATLGFFFDTGADVPPSFGLLSDTSGLPTLFSKGEAVSYAVNPAGDTLTATAGGRTVFTLTVNADGSWRFDLDDQLDHVDGLGENFDLITAADGSTSVPSIDFSPVIVMTDFDGDPARLTAGQFTISVQDDVPIALNDTGTVAAGQTLNVDAINGVLANDSFGADEVRAPGATPGGFVTGVAAGAGVPVAAGVGNPIAGAFGTLTLNADGSYTYVANGSSGAAATAVIDFENLPAGTVLNSIQTIHGLVTVSGTNPALAGNTAVIFDSANPTGGDFDLQTPGYGPGNTTPHGNILIVAENLTDGNGDGLVDDPDDATTFGSILFFDFAGIGSTVTLQGMTIIDVEQTEAAAEVFFYDANDNLIGVPFALPQVGDNGVAEVSFGDISGVARMEVHLNGSGAIDNIAFRPDQDSGRDIFTYEIADADGDVTTATLTIDVTTGEIVTSTSSLFSTALAPAGETVVGTDGDDLLFGGDGDDELIGGLGDDTLFGGAGADRFVYNSSADEGSDEITDFSVLAGDTIEFSDVLDPADGIVDGSFSKTGETVSVELQGGTTLTVVDIDNMINTVDDLFNQNPVV